MRIMLGALALLMSLGAVAQSSGSDTSYSEGEHYEVLADPVPSSAPGKIEVVEVFAYTCGHCYNFEPLIRAWKKEQQDDVAFVQAPAMWNATMENYARGFYTAKALGILEDVHSAVFTAVHQEGKRFNSAEQWADFLATYGVDREKVLKTFNSFGVTSQVRQADARVRGYKISGTPEMVVNGQYRVSSRMTGSHSEMLRVVDYLVEQIRDGEL
ncbi:thiol:disulfide interchange protein DsbA/DsbL [Marinimicrobium sp. ARAG 43.8]|uniref:thiol:disulfide interchange protein DsbA/DsbL n=1 Tax=Marinimicrobium sp. ARAG 43.8 TaxID=3418719 RepID=UPI003CF09ECE